MIRLLKLSDKITPRWVIFLIDCAVITFSLLLAYLLRFNFDVPAGETMYFALIFPFFFFVRASVFMVGKSYAGIVRYTSSKDSQRIFTVITLGTAVMFVFNVVNYFFGTKRYIIPFSVLLIEYFISSFILFVYRVMVKMLFFELKGNLKDKANVIIYGAGESGIITKRTLDRDAGTKYTVIGFVDDDPKLVSKKLEGVKIYSTQELESLLKENEVKFVILSIQNLIASKKQMVADLCMNYNTKVFNVPPVSKWINGELSFKQIKKINIEDLLERDPIVLDQVQIQRFLTGKRILVTGAAGSIGSGLVQQIIKYNPFKVILLDQAESPLFDLEQDLIDKKNGQLIEPVIGDISNYDRMRHLFSHFKPEVVFHAAAYKHVPLMELNPAESVQTNVFGTKVLADLAVEFKTEKFVMISTDKAVNPTNVMGASKRIAEIYVQSLFHSSKSTEFVTTRFGNVLGSNGSVIPRFKKQIEQGGPVTITHPDIERFFMTIPEACQLVLEAGAMGKGGEIFVFDMGKSVKIMDLAKKMIKLSGLELGKDIQIVATGLRPGEKLYEELLNDMENTLPTHHPQILIGKTIEYSFTEVLHKIETLKLALDKRHNMEIVGVMKTIVPEYVSNNSEFQQLDKIKAN